MNKAILLTALCSLIATPALAQVHSGHAAPGSMSDGMVMEHMPTLYMARGAVDAASLNGNALINWDTDAWVGGDNNKLWLRSEGQVEDGSVNDADIWALYSRNVADFWDLQSGVRYDVKPAGATNLAVGFQGLAPYWFETRAFVFLSTEGDLTAQLEQSLDILLTQRLIATPHAQLDFSAQNVERRELGSGLTEAEAGLQVRYEITRKFAPYVDFNYQRALGDTRDYQQADGEDPVKGTIRAGLQFWF